MRFKPPGAHLREPRKLIIYRPNGLLNRLLERATDAHHLSNALHTAAEQPRNTAELLQIPARDFDNYVVKTRLKACRRDFRDRVFNLVERDPKAEFCRDEGERITCRLGRKCRRPGEARIDLRRTRAFIIDTNG